MPRKGENIRKRKDGRWEARYEKCRDQNGRIQYGYLYGRTYEAVKKKKLAVLCQNNLQNSPGKCYVFRNLSEEWMLSMRYAVKLSTYACYETLLDTHILPEFGDTPLRYISSASVYTFSEKLKQQGLSPRTIKNLLILFHSILRYGEMIIPHGESRLQADDSVFFLGLKESVSEVEKLWFHNYNTFYKRAVIIGAGLLGRNLTVLLEKAGFSVKVIEKDFDRCENLANQVDKAMVINGDATDFDLLEAEEIADSDVIIALTDDDKLNLLVALVGKHMGIPKTVVRVGRPEYIMLMEQVGIDVVFSPRLLTASQILRFVRSGEGVVSISTFEGGKAESIEIEITNESPVAGKQLKDIRLPGKALVGVILRENEAIVPRGNTQILDGDHIVLFTLPESVSKLLKYLT